MIQIKDDFLDPDFFQEIQNMAGMVYYHEAEEYSKKYADGLGELKDYNWKAWDGCRRSDNYTDYLNEFIQKVNDEFKVNMVRLEFFHHPIDRFPRYARNIEQHIDGRFQTSGVLYLDEPYCKEGYGTTVIDEYIEAKPNRCAVWPAHAKHNPHFGGIDRRILTFFGYELMGF